MAELLRTSVAPSEGRALFDMVRVGVGLEALVERVAGDLEAARIEVRANVAFGVGAVANHGVDQRPVSAFDAAAPHDVSEDSDMAVRSIPNGTGPRLIVGSAW